MAARIAIITHAQDAFEATPYIARLSAQFWRSWGHQVVIARGRPFPDADLALLHVDLTVVPQDIRRALARYPRVINGATLDISKRCISRNLVRHSDQHPGPVIVKTNRNCGGVQEARYAKANPLKRAVLGVRNRLPWWARTHLGGSNYPVFPSARDVPWAAWRNPHLVVERFQPEMHDGEYVLRRWTFLGDRDLHSIAYAREPVIKAHNSARRGVLGEVPAELRALRQELGFDFGKFDYGVVDGKPVLYDANRTPTVGSGSLEKFGPLYEELARGLDVFLARAQRPPVISLTSSSAP